MATCSAVPSTMMIRAPGTGWIPAIYVMGRIAFTTPWSSFACEMFEKYKTFRTHEAGSQYVLENSAVLSFVVCSGIVLSGGFLVVAACGKNRKGRMVKTKRKSANQSQKIHRFTLLLTARQERKCVSSPKMKTSRRSNVERINRSSLVKDNY